VQDNYSRAATIIGTLATKLDELEGQADVKFRKAGSPKPGTAQWTSYELFFEPSKEPDEAKQLRAAAANQLKQLADASPAAPPDTSFGATLKETIVSVGTDIGHVASDAGSALWGEAKGLGKSIYDLDKFVLYDGTTQLIVNPAGWVHSWQGIGHGIEQLAAHPKDFLDGLWDGVADPTLFDKDKAAWVIYEVVNIVTAKGVGKALKGIGKLKDVDPEGLSVAENLRVRVEPKLPMNINIDGGEVTFPDGSNAHLSPQRLSHIIYGEQDPATAEWTGRHMASSPPATFTYLGITLTSPLVGDRQRSKKQFNR